MYYSKGSIFWATIDDWVGTFLIFVLAMVQIIAFSWVFGIERGWKEAHHGAQHPHPRLLQVHHEVRRARPTCSIVFVAFCWQNLPAAGSRTSPTNRCARARSR